MEGAGARVKLESVVSRNMHGVLVRVQWDANTYKSTIYAHIPRYMCIIYTKLPDILHIFMYTMHIVRF
jgi:hypothetical protein